MNIFKWVKNQRIRYVLKHHSIPFDVWKTATGKVKIFSSLSAVEKARLRLITTLFIHQKTFSGVGGLEITDEMLVIIAAQASLLILKLDLTYYNGWVEVIIYPGAFRVKHDETDQNGLSINDTQTLSGESWLRGPVILSWEDAEHDLLFNHAGHNIIVHEFSHKLDMLNGRANGMPPLHPTMHIEHWTTALTDAFETLQNRINHNYPTYINAYAATNPAEFFAVISEYFFTAPKILNKHCPDVYQQLTEFYLQYPCKTRSSRVSVQ